MTKRKVGVHIPITGSVYVEVEIDAEADDDSAFFAACDAYKDGTDQIEWEFTQHVTRGNVCSAMLNDFSVEDVEA